MKNLKDDYTLIKWDSVNEEKVWFEEDLQEAILNFHKDIFGKEIIRDRFNEAKIISPKEIYDKMLKHLGDWEE